MWVTEKIRVMKRIKQLLGFKGHTFATVIVFHMKSGNTLKIPCDEFTFSQSSGAVQSYKFIGQMNGALMTCSLSEIEAISQISYNRFINYLK